MAERLTKAAIALASLPVVAVAAAQPQPTGTDPTRPPSFSASGDAVAPASAQRLQSILIAPGRRLAVIDGRTVPLGGRIGGATVVQVSETHVMLRQGAELTTLELYPGVAVRDAGRRADGGDKKGQPQ